MSVGMALAERMLAARFNRAGHEIVDHYTFAIASDGDIQEGIASEASSLAGHLGLGRLIAFYDDNNISARQADTASSFSEDVAERYEAYGWHVQNVGEDIVGRAPRAGDARTRWRSTDRPSLIIVPLAHRLRQPEQAGHRRRARLAARRGGGAADQGGLRLGPRQAVLRARRRRSQHFRAASSARTRARGRVEQRFDAYREAHPELADELLQMIDAGELPDGWDGELPRFDPATSRSPPARRRSTVIQWAAASGPAARRRLGRPGAPRR